MTTVLNDSKQLSKRNQERVVPFIDQQVISFAAPLYIIKNNVFNASIRAMREDVLKREANTLIYD
jgi:ribonuclease HII